MLKKCLVAAIFMTLVLTSLSMAQIDKIAIFNESVGWTDVATAAAATEIILADVSKAKDITVYNDADMGSFASENTNDGNVDIIVLFGYVPVSLYAPGNGEADGSLFEMFLESGDIIINTADYVFYVTQGGGANGDTGLKNMTDSNFDCWTDGAVNTPTADGEKYIPSYEGHTAPRCFKASQIEDDPDWEVEVAFGSDGGDNIDPAIIRNVTYGGRVGIAMQVSAVTPKGEVISEMIENYLGGVVSAVEPGAKLTTTWGTLK